MLRHIARLFTKAHSTFYDPSVHRLPPILHFLRTPAPVAAPASSTATLGRRQRGQRGTGTGTWTSSSQSAPLCRSGRASSRSAASTTSLHGFSASGPDGSATMSARLSGPAPPPIFSTAAPPPGQSAPQSHSTGSSRSGMRWSCTKARCAPASSTAHNSSFYLQNTTSFWGCHTAESPTSRRPCPNE